MTFEHLYSKKLYTGCAKCVFVYTQVEYQSHIVSTGVIAVDPAKMHAIMDWPEPMCRTFLAVSQVNQLLQTFCIANAKIAAPLSILLWKEAPWHFGHCK